MRAEYINHMGDDLTVVNAARVSFDKESDWATGPYPDLPGGELKERDRKLITFLSSHGHWTPFSHPQITLRETVPIFVARQRFKHMVGFTYNEISRRYVDSEPKFYVPETWRKRADNKKQGSSEEIVKQVALYPETGMRPPQRYQTPQKFYTELIEHALSVYQRFIDAGIAPEQARMVLPQSMMTSYYVTGSLAAFARAYTLRSAPDSQAEIRELAAQWDSIIRPLFPVSWEALTNAS